MKRTIYILYSISARGIWRGKYEKYILRGGNPGSNIFSKLLSLLLFFSVQKVLQCFRGKQKLQHQKSGKELYIYDNYMT